jgi:transposase
MISHLREIIMRPKKPFPPETIERMEALLSSTRSIYEFKKIQAVYFRAKYDYNASQIAKMVGLKLQTVKNIHSVYLKNGEAFLKSSNASRGGRNISYLSLEQEKAFLAEFEAQGKQGKILEISQIHSALQEKVGIKLPLSTTYRMLHRRGWRKLAPRPKHPKSNKEAQENFKNNFEKLISEAQKLANFKKLSLLVMFQDEARFGRISDSRNCWAPPACRPVVAKQIIREYTYAYGAVCPWNGIAHFLILPNMRAKTMEIFLTEVAKRHSKEFIFMIYDGASCHNQDSLKMPKNMATEKQPEL